MLVGNKADLSVQRFVFFAFLPSHFLDTPFPILFTDPSPPYRQVTTAEGEALAKEWGATFLETSARTAENVPRVFEAITAEIEKDLNPEPEAKEKAGCTVM